ncbi:MAG: CHAT domain-containing protein, partial [Crocinitomicaceae bacterium]|nr:CHAT domain-containing protein [Crocinitomicaceae bacterium]
LDSLYAVAESIEKKLVTKSTYFSELDKLFKADWKDIQNKLGKNDVVIEFICFKPDTLCIKKDREENLYCALVLKKDQKYPEMIELCSEIQLQQLLQGYKNTESEKINSLYNDDKLYNLILKPILKNIKKGSNILYSPDGILHRISFPAISDNKGKQLCTQYNLSLLSSSLSLLVNYSPVLKTDFNVLMFGAIDYSDTIGNAEIWEYLPGTLTETEGIKNVLGNSRHKYLLKKDLDATESFVRDSASHYTITHFATHGFYFPDHELLQNAMQTDTIESGEIEFRSNKKSNGRTSFVESKNPLMRAGLAMSSANTVWSIFENINQDDGVLTAFELSMINLLQTKLVVLSACETGLGEIYQNEGVFGMQRALKMAGVEFIIVSLWKVPDTETSEFMIYFYSELIKSMNIRDAFNATQIHFQKIYGPYFWGAFQLVE